MIIINSTGTGTAGRIAQINYVPCETTVDGHMIIIRANEKVTQRYLGCALKAHQRKVMQLDEGSTGQTELNRERLLEEIMISYPESFDEQEKIVALLDSLDNKIRQNIKINDNLQQQISEIYKAWYQDFSCASNVPMIASEYGIIPQGWHYSIVGDLCKSISVTHKFDTDKLIFLNTGDIEDGRFLHENYMAVSEMPGQAKKSIARGDILFSEIRPINRHFAYVNFSAKDYVVSTKLMIIRATSLDSRRLYHFLTSQDVLMELQMQAESRSGTFPQIRFDNVSKLPILIADDKTEVAFTNLLHTVYAQIEHNNLENGKLRSLRDNLLPRLMSGELDVSELDI
ncbi:restriction endonuclease subunit S [Desulfovibrio piger]|nr:restriction endonuclease subunit S [Desulfovibrio piger]